MIYYENLSYIYREENVVLAIEIKNIVVTLLVNIVHCMVFA